MRGVPIRLIVRRATELLIFGALATGCSTAKNDGVVKAPTTAIALSPSTSSPSTTSIATITTTATESAPEPVITPTTTGEAPNAGGATRITVRIDADLGSIVDGQFVPEYGPDAMRWELRIDQDPTKQYVYASNRGQAEPGDVGCMEQVLFDGTWFGRESGNGPWERLDDEAAKMSADDVADLGRLLPQSVEALTRLLGPTPVPTSRADGVLFDGVDVDGRQVKALFLDVGGLGIDFDSGKLTIRADTNGSIQALDLTATARSDARSAADLTYSFVVETLDPLEPLVDPAATGPSPCSS